MLKRAFLVLIFILSVGANESFAQVKITPNTETLPKEFQGHDAAILFDNLSALLKDSKGKNAAIIREELKGKAVYENLMIDDLFAFNLSAADYTSGKNAVNNLPYRGAKFALRSIKNLPSPQPRYFDNDCVIRGGNGTGSGEYKFSLLKHLVSDFNTSQPLETVWTTSYLPIKTVYSPEAVAKKYTGKSWRCTEGGGKTEVPSPQLQYGLGFVKAQPFPLVDTLNKNFSLTTYSADFSTAPGIVAWLENGEQYSGDFYRPIFIVRLAAPFLASETFETPDAVEKKMYRADLNVLYVELAGIWIYDTRTGKIISKSGEQAVIPIDDGKSATIEQKTDSTVSNPAALSDIPLKIIYTPLLKNTEEARKNNVQGTINLKVTFLASGEIGSITVVNGLPHGLTEAAIEAARGIRFSPAVKKGVPTTTTKIVQYSYKIE